MTPTQHARRIVDNYTSHGLGDPRNSDDHAVACAVSVLDCAELKVQATRDIIDTLLRAYNERNDELFDVTLARIGAFNEEPL